MFASLTVCTGTIRLLFSQFELGLCVCLPHSLYWDFVFACLTVYTGTMRLLASQFVLGLCVCLLHILYWDCLLACFTVCTGTMCLLALKFVLGLCVCLPQQTIYCHHVLHSDFNGGSGLRLYDGSDVKL